MVQVISDEYSGNVFGRLGKGIGKGLSEQLPKELERTRLSEGLKRFEKQSGGLTPVQQAARLLGIPGMTAEHLYTIAPLLKQQAQRQEGERRGGEGALPDRTQPPGARPGMEQPSDVGAPAPQTGIDPYSEQTDLAGQKLPLKPLNLTQAQLTPAIRKSPEELFNRAQQLSRENPYTYPTPQEALSFVNAEEDTRLANLQAQQQVGDVADKIQKNIKTGLEAVWGKENTEKGIPGTVQSKLLRNVEADLANPKNKLSERQVIDKWGEVGKRIAKAETNLNAKSAMGWLGAASAGLGGTALINWVNGYLPQEIRRTLNAARQVYKDADALEEYQDIIANKYNLSSAGSAMLAFPPENTTANKFISSLPDVSLSTTGKFKKGQSPTDLSIRAADTLSQYLTDKDSILSYAMQLKKKGLDPQEFLDRLEQNREAGIFDPSSRQLEEMQRGYPRVPSLGDMYLFFMSKQKLPVE